MDKKGRYPEPVPTVPVWRRPVTVVATLVVTLVTGAVVAVFQPSVTGLLKRATETGAPIVLNSAQIFDTDDTNSVAFGRKKPFTASDLQSLASCDTPCMRKQGATQVGYVVLAIAITGNRGSTVRITNVTPQSECTEPIDGSLFVRPNAGGSDSIAMTLTIDKPNKQAVYTDADGTERPYFPSKTIAVADAEQVQFEINSKAESRSCRFRLIFDVLEGDETIKVLVPAKDQPPFGVTAALEENRYQNVYLGGVACPLGRFVRASKTYFETGSEPACSGPNN